MGSEDDLVALRREFEDFRYFLPDALIEAEVPSSRLTFMNRSARILLGYDDSDLEKGLLGFELVDEASRERIVSLLQEHYERSVAVGKPYERTGTQDLIDVRLRRKDGSIFPAEGQGSYVLDEQGRRLRTRIMFRDISERLHAQEAQQRQDEERARAALSQLEQAHAALLARLPGMAYRWRYEGDAARLELVSEGCHRLTGFRPGELLADGGRRFENLVHPDDKPAVVAAQARALRGKRPYRNEYRIVTAEGAERWVSEEGAGIYDGAGRIVAREGFVIDISGRRRAEAEHQELREQLQRVEKLETLGLLVAGIAHNFNNVLTAILGNVYLAEKQLPEGSPCRPMLADARFAALRGAELVSQLMVHGRPDEEPSVPIDVAELIDEASRMVRPVLRPGARLVVEPPLRPTTIHGRRVALQQALVNLLVNARDAIADGGLITLSAHAPGESTDEQAPDGTPAPYCELWVADTGTGIPSGVLPLIWDPFFTTKAPGKGTGLGLATALSIVRAHGGTIDVESEAGSGTTFRIRLPVNRHLPGIPETSDS